MKVIVSEFVVELLVVVVKMRGIAAGIAHELTEHFSWHSL